MKHRETIGQLYELFSDEIYEQYKKQENIEDKVTKIEEKLLNTLDESQKNILDDILDYKANNEDKLNKYTFVFAFRLAIKLFAEIISL